MYDSLRNLNFALLTTKFLGEKMQLKSLDKPDPEIDELWKKEAESRIDAYDEGNHTSVTVQEAISNIIN